MEALTYDDLLAGGLWRVGFGDARVEANLMAGGIPDRPGFVGWIDCCEGSRWRQVASLRPAGGGGRSGHSGHSGRQGRRIPGTSVLRVGRGVRLVWSGRMGLTRHVVVPVTAIEAVPHG